MPKSPPQAIDNKKTVSQAIFESLSKENRRILSDWRALVLLRRATGEIPSNQRRWLKSPSSVYAVYPYLRQMLVRGELKPLLDIPNLYEVTVPYARTSPIEEDEILMEIHPFAALCYLSALAYHSLTDELPKEITAFIPTEQMASIFPLGTDSRDWEGLVLVRGRPLRRIGNRPIKWIRINANRYFGVAEYRPHGYPVRVTTPERTLLDGLQEPQLSGGIENVLRAWVMARDTIDLDALTSHVDRFNISVLRQRVGFLMEELDLSHPVLETWRTQAHRGGSSKLLGSAPYAPEFSRRWNLSINAPITVLQE